VSPAAAETREALIERFKAECIPRYAHVSGPGRQEKVRACVTEGMKERALERPSGASTLQLAESTPPLVNKRGPAVANGVIYSIRGYSPGRHMPDRFGILPYFLKSLNADGWDVVSARVPASEPDPGPSRGQWMAWRAEPFVRERLAALKAEGYRKVVVYGRSWGAWLSLLLGKNSGADALIVNAPNAFGTRTSAYTGRQNPNFGFSLSQFSPAIDGVSIPTALILPDDSEWDPDPAVRGAIAEKHFMHAGVAHLLIVRPPGFTGHMAGYLPFFDYAFGRCIEAFLDNPTTQSCQLPAIANDDFRSILDRKQVGDADERRVASGDELGRDGGIASTADVDPDGGG
jgi:pimeloyl-ACP methyl ester carboxylesterase